VAGASFSSAAVHEAVYSFVSMHRSYIVDCNKKLKTPSGGDIKNSLLAARRSEYVVLSFLSEQHYITSWQYSYGINSLRHHFKQHGVCVSSVHALRYYNLRRFVDILILIQLCKYSRMQEKTLLRQGSQY